MPITACSVTSTPGNLCRQGLQRLGQGAVHLPGEFIVQFGVEVAAIVVVGQFRTPAMDDT
ncbi:hypothetical protein ACWELB_17685 [Streptomyces asiaticus]